MALHNQGWFVHFAKLSARAAGKPPTFAVALLTVLVWATTGPLFDYSDSWQLVINTGTTVVTFLMVFLIQNSQNRDSDAVQLKLDELIRAVRGAHNALLDLEELDDKTLGHLREHYASLAREARGELERHQTSHEVGAELGETPKPRASPRRPAVG